jgi:hypothetical protein
MSTRSRIVFDERYDPLFYIAYPAPFTDEDFKPLLDRVDALLDRGTPFAWINDGRTPYLPNAVQRDLVARHQKQRADDYRRLVPGVAMVLTNPAVRGVMTAIAWLNPFPFPVKTFETLDDSETFLRNALHLPPGNLLAADPPKSASKR